MQGKPPTTAETTSSIDYWQVIKNRYGVILLTFLLVFMTAAVITSVMPEKYESTSVVQVHPSMIAINPIGNNTGSNPGSLMTRNYMENEFETIVAPETLKKAAEDIELAARWGKDLEEVVEILTDIVGAAPRRGTDFIEIAVRHATPADAKAIADAVSNAYMERRRSSEVNRAQRALKALDDELVAQSDLVQDNRKELTVLIQQYGIPYFEDGHSNPLGMTESKMLEMARQKLDDFKVQADQIEISIKKLVELSNDDLINFAAGLDLPAGRGHPGRRRRS